MVRRVRAARDARRNRTTAEPAPPGASRGPEDAPAARRRGRGPGGRLGRIIRRALSRRPPHVGTIHPRNRLEDGVIMAALKTRFISHGTLGSKDLERTREFYEQFLGLEVVRTSPVSLMVRLGGPHVYAVVLTKNKERMPRCYHNGIDVAAE